MPKLVAGLSCALSVIASFAHAQDAPQAEPLPQRMTLWYYPDALNGRRGHQLDIERIFQKGSEVTAAVTMYGLGLDRCRLQSQPTTGKLEGNKLTLKVKAEPGDNLTCSTTYELQRGADGVFEGTYENAGKAGSLRRR